LNEHELIILVNKICQKHELDASNSLIPILQEIQSKIGYIPETALKRVSQNIGVSPSHVYGVATFYHQFRLRPGGRHTIRICRGTACHVAGATDIYNTLLKELEIIQPNDTSQDGLFTINQVRCIGACSLAPIVKIDDEVYGRIDQKKLKIILDNLKEEYQ
jgi:NADH:ubiquinone oxidoreductase subunit E